MALLFLGFANSEKFLENKMEIPSSILVILVTYMILCVIWWFRLDHIDKIGVRNFVRSCSTWYSGNYITVGMYIKFLRLALTTPFMSLDFLSRWTEGGFYSGNELTDEQVVSDMNNKLIWWKVFTSEGISTPLTVMYNVNGRSHQVSEILANKMYIKKPIYGNCGRGIVSVVGSDIPHITDTNYLIQEKISDCSKKSARHFRIVTVIDDDQPPINLIELTADGGIVSNHAAGASVLKCGAKCPGTTFNEQEALDKIIEQLIQLHHRRFRKIFSIGWDVMVACEETDTTAYCLEGNIRHSTWYYPDLIDANLINDYKQRYYRFLVLKNAV